MEWLWLAIGATGSYTFLFLGRQVHRLFRPTPAHAVHFSPKGGCTDAVVRAIGAARREVLVLAYSFTSNPIAQALVDPHHAIAHNKVMVIDGHTVITGSFNFTNQAEHENAENLLVLRDYPDLARAYRQNFVAHKEHARAPQSKAAPAPAHDHAAARQAA